MDLNFLKDAHVGRFNAWWIERRLQAMSEHIAVGG
jgi:hypothetical protein